MCNFIDLNNFGVAKSNGDLLFQLTTQNGGLKNKNLNVAISL